MASFSKLNSERQMVVLVHGLAANHLVMVSLAKSLSKAFAATLNWGYKSLWSPIERHSRELATVLRQLDASPEHDRIHLVTHSMGSIIGRLALADYLPKRF